MRYLALLILLISFKAHSITYSIDFQNGTKEQKDKVTGAINLAHEKMKTPEFKKSILEYYEFYQTEKTNYEIYLTLISSHWSYKVNFYSKCISSANAYVIPDDPTVNLNWCKMKNWNEASMASTLIHEYTHVLGFTHDYKRTPKRPHSVPYAVGSIIEELLGGKKTIKYVPWYRRIFNWFT